MRLFSCLIFSLFTAFQSIAQCDAGTLYGVNGGSSGDNSNLITLDKTNGNFQTVGDIGFSGVKGLAIHPATCEMYGVAKPDGSSGSSVQLIRINLTNGAGTPIGPQIDTKVTDLTFSPSGELYGWDRENDRFLIINLQNAGTTQLADLSAIDWDRIGIAFDRNGNLYAKDDDDDLYRINPVTGAVISSVPISGPGNDLDNLLAFDNNNMMYSVDAEAGSGLDKIYLINPATGDYTFVTSTTVSAFFEDNFTAIEFCPQKTAIPTLSQWGFFILGLMMMIFGVVAIRKRSYSY